MILLDWTDGSQDVLANLGEDGAFVDDGFAEDHDLTVGSRVPVTFPSGNTRSFTIDGIFDPPTGGSPFGQVTVSEQAWDAEVERPTNLYSFIDMEGGESDASLAALETVLDDFPNAKVATREEFIDNQISGLSSILNILYVLLALSILVSLFGIVNTLVLTVFERTREIGMLRAIGMTRRQVRRMIRHESVITVADRGGDRDRARDRPRRAADRARRLHRLHVPDDAGDRLRDRGGPRRDPRGDLPCAARGEAEPARGAALRVSDAVSSRLRPWACAHAVLADGGLGDGGGDARAHVPVEDAGDDVLGAELVVRRSPSRARGWRRPSSPR